VSSRLDQRVHHRGAGDLFGRLRAGSESCLGHGPTTAYSTGSCSNGRAAPHSCVMLSPSRDDLRTSSDATWEPAGFTPVEIDVIPQGLAVLVP
jgi:hypothetical protein